MCLAIPAKINQINEDHLAIVDILGVTREVSVDLTPQAGVGDYVLVHAGFAIEVVDEESAQETIDLINEFPELISDDAFAGSGGSFRPSLGALFAEADKEDQTSDEADLAEQAE